MRFALVTVVAAILMSGCTEGSEPEPTRSPTPTEPTTAADCTPARTLLPQTTSETIEVDGEERTFLIHAPEGYDGTERTPVVFTFHGLGSSASAQLAYSRWAIKATEEGFLVVSPQARGARPQWDVRATGADSDNAFIDAVVDRVDEIGCVDTERRYATGISNGSVVTLALACRNDGTFAAYGAIAAAFYQSQCDAATPASIVYFHGTADEIVPYEGGPTPIEPVAPTQDSLNAWARHGGCDAEALLEEVASGVTLYDWASCDAGARLQAYIVDGGGHTWPGSTPIPGLGLVTDAIDATDIMWDFFEDQTES